ncbi:MAG TPA: hypothetical protein VK020_12400 [Microlunatus sp.]|nr:hypothetical protein [Microlunatus sp.]
MIAGHPDGVGGVYGLLRGLSPTTVRSLSDSVEGSAGPRELTPTAWSSEGRPRGRAPWGRIPSDPPSCVNLPRVSRNPAANHRITALPGPLTIITAVVPGVAASWYADANRIGNPVFHTSLDPSGKDLLAG